MLLIQPSYYYYVGNPRSAKQSVYYSAFQRATPYWDENCGMSREQASVYYSQEFVNPTGIYEAYDVSHALLWINGIYLGCLVAFLGFAFSNAGFESTVGFSALTALCVRVAWIVTIPIVFHRIKMSYSSA